MFHLTQSAAYAPFSHPYPTAPTPYAHKALLKTAAFDILFIIFNNIESHYFVRRKEEKASIILYII